MGSLAQLAKAAGCRVTGCDHNVYPPMSTQLEAAGIELIEGFSSEQLALAPDVFVIGNVVSRGNPLMEAILDRGLPYMSGPEWLAKNVLQDKWVLAVSGTHGKTSTSSMLAWILEDAGYQPGYLIGGVPANLPASARLSDSGFFVIEADEYDTAFFDKRSKFVHYRPRTLVINNLEFDHADIFADLAAIQNQFHHLLRTVPQMGQVIYPEGSEAIASVMSRGCWSEQVALGTEPGWQVVTGCGDGSQFKLLFQGEVVGEVSWHLHGEHNLSNALAAIVAARHVGVEPQIACEALAKFSGVKRRMELLAEVAGVSVYDDFAHHPTAIELTLKGLRAKVGSEAIYALVEPRSNSMQQGVFNSRLGPAINEANRSYWFQAKTVPGDLREHLSETAFVSDNIEALCERVLQDLQSQTRVHLVIMSNGGFSGIHQRIIRSLQARS